jgi:hypothetical protein
VVRKMQPTAPTNAPGTGEGELFSVTRTSTKVISHQLNTSAKTGSPVLARPALRPSTLTAEQAATATFITDLSADVIKLADRHGFDALAFVLDLAKLGARNLGPECRRIAGVAAVNARTNAASPKRVG